MSVGGCRVEDKLTRIIVKRLMYFDEGSGLKLV